ncbi:MAG: DUF3048 domain-containing protein [Clostridia bacterium]|jgi:hypothetical protein|nr:DUF3048 domain-containing protein [Clostridia bacterium]
MRERLEARRKAIRARKRRRFISLLLIISIIGGTIYSCSNKNIENKPVEVEKPKEVVDMIKLEPAIEIDPLEGKDINPLTGLYIDEEDVIDRPVAVMINNHNRAQPQSGVEAADIIYELPVEGEFTRLLAIYQGYKDIEKIGPVRSARHYFLYPNFDHDAVYIHYGASYIARKYFTKLNTPNINGELGYPDSELSWRDKERIKTKGMEHSAYTSGEKIEKVWKAKEFRTNKDVDNEFKFNEEDTDVEGKRADKLTLEYTDYQIAKFEYDEERKEYLRFQTTNSSGNFHKHIDRETGNQLAFKNVIVQYATVKAIPGDKEGRKDITLVSEGTGYYLTNGNVMNIKWVKSANRNTTIYKDLEGNELKLNAGKTFICIFDKNKKKNVEITAKPVLEEVTDEQSGTNITSESSAE